MSAALGRLRAALNDPLFVRQGQRLVATEFALGLRDPLRHMLEDTQRLLTGPAPFDPGLSQDVFTLSGSDFFSIMLMPELAQHLSRTAPGMRVHLVDLVPDSHVDSIDRHQVDMAIIPETPLPVWVDARAVHGSRFVVIARRDHPGLTALDAGQMMGMDPFCTLQHVVFSPEGKPATMGDAALAQVGRQRRVAMTLPVFSGVCHAVAHSDLIALVPHQLAHRMAPRLGLSVYEPPIPIAPVTIILAWHKRASRTPAHRWLRDQIADILGAMEP